MKRIFLFFLLPFFMGPLLYMAGSEPDRHGQEAGAAGSYNHLIGEKSPYLIQHADNPVEWYPWGPEAFAKAEREGKLIFLSIGYSTCHWCHVMEEESFSNPDVARLMNDLFVSIKVDREERPDIDRQYTAVARMMTENVGWPLNIIMTPDRRPFFASSYIPKENRFGRVGMMALIPRVKELWSSRRDDISERADKVLSYLRQPHDRGRGGALGEAASERAYRQLATLFDSRYGGFGEAPKFPRPQIMLFLLRYGKRTGDQRAVDMVETTLSAIRRGGIYDHLGFGVHRYSTDERWLVPHFEKMLYDQAMLSMAYVEAYQVKGGGEYRTAAEEIFTYVGRDMTGAGGGFLTAEGADSGGEEGLFYLWSDDEIGQILNDREGGLAREFFNIEKDGNFVDRVAGGKTGKNILYRAKSVDEIAHERRLSREDLSRGIEGVRQKLLAYREKRERPNRDDKVLADWNGLMIAALAKGAQAFGEPRYARAAERAAEFILKGMRSSDGRLLHRYRKDQAVVPANLDDYSFLIWGLIELYEATFKTAYLTTALDLNDELIKHFWDGDGGGFFFTPDDGEAMLTRQKDGFEGALPSGNGVAMLNLLRLGRLTANPLLEERAARLGEAFSGEIEGSPISFTGLMSAVEFVAASSHEVVIVGDSGGDDTRRMVKALRKGFFPGTVVVYRPTGVREPDILRLAKYVEPYTALNGKATAYVCTNYRCSLPTTDTAQMLRLLGMADGK